MSNKRGIEFAVGTIVLIILAILAFTFALAITFKIFGGAEVQVYLLGRELSQYEDVHISFITADYGQGYCEQFGRIKVLKSFSFQDSLLIKIVRFYKVFREVNGKT